MYLKSYKKLTYKLKYYIIYTTIYTIYDKNIKFSKFVRKIVLYKENDKKSTFQLFI